MISQVYHSSVIRWTNLALKSGPVRCVDEHVRLQCVTLCERRVADFTTVRFLPGMNAHVSPQLEMVRTGVRAVLTLERSLASVHPDVMPHVGHLH